jgi:hypothetical protein
LKRLVVLVDSSLLRLVYIQINNTWPFPYRPGYRHNNWQTKHAWVHVLTSVEGWHLIECNGDGKCHQRLQVGRAGLGVLLIVTKASEVLGITTGHGWWLPLYWSQNMNPRMLSLSVVHGHFNSDTRRSYIILHIVSYFKCTFRLYHEKEL